jgi:hypothetical protein
MKPNTMVYKSITSHMFSTNVDKENDKHKETKGEAIKHGLQSMWKKYGTVFIGTYLSVYVGTLTGLFFALDYDIFSIASVGLDPAAAVSKVGILVISFKLYFLNSSQFQACDLVEKLTGNTSMPQYIRDNPRGDHLIILM